MSIAATIDHFKNLTALVVGDVMLDAYLWGKVSRISPEAPVPVVRATERQARLGGAANVAKNVVALGANALVVSVVGADRSGEQLIELLADEQINTSGLISSSERRTTVKTRVISGHQHIVRVDEEDLADLPLAFEDQLLDQVATLLPKVQVVILEDYNKGVLTPRVITQIISLAANAKVPIAVDPKVANFWSYQGVQLFKPNKIELEHGIGAAIHGSDKEGIISAAALLQKKLGNEITLVTLSEHGIFAQAETETLFLEAHERSIADVSGAGDSVIATAALCLAAGANLHTLAALSNLAGGIVCEQVGVVPITHKALRAEAQKLVLTQ